MSASKPSRSGLAPLRNRNFTLLWIGQTISVAGNGMFTIALPLVVLRFTHSPLDLALVFMARTITSIILLLIGGTVVDRLSRRAVMLASDATCGVVLAVLTILVVIQVERLWVFIALAAILGSASAFFRPASTAIVRDLLPEDQLMRANSLSSLSESLAQFLVGPILGGILLALIGSAWAFGIDAVTFVVSAVCLAAMRNITEVRAAKERLTRGMAEGLRYCRSQPWLWWSTLGLGLANLACFAPSTLLAPLIVQDAFHSGSVAFGIMVAAIGGAGALVSVIAGRLPTPGRPVVAMWVAWIAAGILTAGVALSAWLWLADVFFGLAWGMVYYGNIVWFTALQARTPATLLGRVSSVDWLLSLSLTPLGTLIASAAVVGIGVRPTVLIGGLIAAAAGAVLLIPGVAASDKADAASQSADLVPTMAAD
ncbi:MAG TPA: MFS transporter [Trebonia sp.]|nr:MFS transporter [Trebonia sp.]